MIDCVDEWVAIFVLIAKSTCWPSRSLNACSNKTSQEFAWVTLPTQYYIDCHTRIQCRVLAVVTMYIIFVIVSTVVDLLFVVPHTCAPFNWVIQISYSPQSNSKHTLLCDFLKCKIGTIRFKFRVTCWDMENVLGRTLYLSATHLLTIQMLKMALWPIWSHSWKTSEM